MRANTTLADSLTQERLPQTAASLELLFARCFESGWQTRLEGGADEPFYKAAKAGQLAVIYYRADYFSSALHEIAHWCLAGEQRRQKDDYGYWYIEGARDLAQQKQFEAVERKPQALEKLFAEACQRPFRVSVDNLSLPDYDPAPFAKQVEQQAQYWRQHASRIPRRAAIWINQLNSAFSS